MKICLDFDGTYTADPIFWDRVIELAKQHGHDVICATMRYDQSEGDAVRDALAHQVSAIHFTERRAKQPALADRGVYPDVWIDDSPQWLVQDAR